MKSCFKECRKANIEGTTLRVQRYILSTTVILALLGFHPAEAQTNKKQKTQKSAIKAATKNSTVATIPGQAVGDIQITGNRKIEKDAIIAMLKTKTTEEYSEEKVSQDVKALFASGYFYNVTVSKSIAAAGLVLTYQVLEKPSIVEIDYDGNFEIKDDDLAEAAGIKAYEILNLTKIREAEEKLLKLYEEKGYFLAKVEAKVTDVVKDETSKLTFHVQENDKVRVKKVTFIGNGKLKDSFLKDKMITREGGFFSFMSGAGSYKQDAFERDVQLLKYLYFNEGYVQVKVDRPQVYVTPDKKNIYITIRLEEGEQFNVGSIDYSGDILFSRSELDEVIKIDESKIFSYDQLQKDLSELQAKYGDLGFAFANVIPRTQVDEKEKIVNITFEFDKGQKVYFGQINVIGNSKTRDKVLRRELKIKEGELYHETRKRESVEAIQRLGFFEEVNFKTSTPADKTDQLNIDIVVKERNTGTIQFGAGYGSATGFTLQGQVTQSNFLGKGQNMGASLQASDSKSDFSFTFTEPHYNDTDWSVGYNIYQSRSARSDYIEKKGGGSVEFGHPLSENIRGLFAFKADKTDLEAKREDGVNINDYEIFPLDTASGDTYSVKGSLVFDKRNDRFAPTKGWYASSSVEYAGLGGDLKYTKSFATVRYFQKVFWDVVFRNNLTYGVISSNVEGEDPPFNELYLLGGPYSLRGYRWLRVGKRKLSNKVKTELMTPEGGNLSAEDAEKRAMKPFGGRQQLYYSAELEFPLVAEAGIKGVVFYDIGQAEDVIAEENFFSDIGFGFRWFSPIGPLRFEWGIPLKRDPVYHEPSVFEFSIGSPF